MLKRFDCAVSALAFDKSGKRLAVGTWDGGLLILDSSRGKVLREIDEHSETITALAFDPGGEYLASGSADDRLIVWDTDTGEELLTMHQGNEYDVTTLAFSADGKRIATGDGENQLKVWDTDSGDEIETLGGHDEPVTCVLFDPDGNIVTGSWDDTILIRRKGSDERLEGHTEDITGLAMNRNGSRVFSASEDKTVRVWDAKTGKLMWTLKGSPVGIRSLAVSPDGTRVFAGSEREIREWRIGSE